jgi:hypothetical protein
MWRFEIQSIGFSETLEGVELEPFLERDPHDPERIQINQSVLVASLSTSPTVPFKEGYAMERRATMYRRLRGFLPLSFGFSTMKAQFLIEGQAVPDLEFGALHGGWPVDLKSVGSHFEFKPSSAIVPGQVTLITWSPKTGLNDGSPRVAS